METSYVNLRAGPTRNVIRRTWRLCNPQNLHAPPRRDRRCHNTCLYIPVAYAYCSVLSRKKWRLALSNHEELLEVRKHGWDRLEPIRAINVADLLTDDAIFLRINGTPGWGRWARVLGGQFGWLSERLNRVDAYCSGCVRI